MVAIVIDAPYRSTTGRKPVSPAVLYDFHNDTAGGLVVPDRYGNGPTLTINGSAGAIWTADRGWARPDGATHRAEITAGHAKQSYIENNIVPKLLTPGAGLLVHARMRWASLPTTNEAYVCIGRMAASLGGISFNTAGSGNITIQSRGIGATGVNSITWSPTIMDTPGLEHSFLWFVQAKAGGFDGTLFLNGVQVGNVSESLWSADGGATPVASDFVYPNSLTMLAQRTGTVVTPTWGQYQGATNAAGTSVANVGIVAQDAPSFNVAADLALELASYPRFVGEILASI